MIKRGYYKERHQSLDELASDYLKAHPKALLSDTNIITLMEYSYTLVVKEEREKQSDKFDAIEAQGSQY